MRQSNAYLKMEFTPTRLLESYKGLTISEMLKATLSNNGNIFIRF
jgi:hypothetical protein